jgi:hypothetical protein
MRLSIYHQFVVGVVRPNGGWSKGRPIAYIEAEDKCGLFNFSFPRISMTKACSLRELKICSLRTTRQTRSGVGEYPNPRV